MKTIRTFAFALALIPLWGCNDKIVEDKPIEVVEGAEATLSLSVVGSVHYTKASGPITGESKVTNSAVFVFRTSDGTLDNSVFLDHLPTVGDVLNITSGERNVYVVVNFPTGSLDGVVTNDQLINKTIHIDTQKQDFLTMSAGKIMTIVPGTNIITGVNSLNLQRNVARINIGNINLSGSLSQSIRIVRVHMLNVRTNSSLVCKTRSTPESYLLTTSGWSYGEGMVYISNGFPIGSVATSSLSETPVPIPAAGANAPSWGAYFYVFEHLTPEAYGINSFNCVKLVIEAIFTDPDTLKEETIFYPVFINFYDPYSGSGVDQNNQFIRRNTQYTVSATIKNIGVPDPELELATSAMNIDLQVTPWNTVSKDLNF